MNETLTINDLEFEVRRSSRRKTLGVTVDRFGELVVHAPEQSGCDELRTFLKKKMLWVNQKLLLKDADRKRQRIIEPVSGETFFYLGRSFRLKRVDEQNQPLQFDGNWFTIRRRDCRKAPVLFKEWYRRNGLEWMTVRIREWQLKTGTTPSAIRVEELGFRWASCSRNGVVRFNWKLLQLPVRLIDYVIAHELTHLSVANHSTVFWQTLEQAMPDWKPRKDELDRSQAELVWVNEM